MILSGSLVGNHILVAKPILALSQIGGLAVVWGGCGGESRGCLEECLGGGSDRDQGGVCVGL